MSQSPPAHSQPSTAVTEHPNQFALLAQKRFAPFFWTQFTGAANDNLFKFALTVLITYQLQLSWLPPAMAGLVIGGLFILPFVLLSATSGQLTDKFEKTTIIKWVKNLEILIMALAAWGFTSVNVPVLLSCVFLMGVHSTLFGPVKFAYMPQVLSEQELTGGTGMVEMGTFVAILLGQLAGGLLIASSSSGSFYVSVSCLLLAFLGRLTSHWIPVAPSSDTHLKINWNPVSETWRNLKIAYTNRVVFRSLLGISWMWFFGAVFLNQFPSFAKEVLQGDAKVASLLLVVFSVGIGIGSLLCEVLSRRHVEIGLVPLGTLGMSIFAFDLYLASQNLPVTSSTYDIASFLIIPAHWRVMADLALLSLFAGLYSVPMYALIQLRSPVTHRARIIAANNILNALFMIISSLLCGYLLSWGASISEIFLITACLNLIVGAYIFLLVPEYLLRFIAWILSHFIYRFKILNAHHIPTSGAAILACNHVSYIDAILLMAASPRPIVFIMDHRIFKMPILGKLFQLAKAIPIAPKSEDPQAYEKALKMAAQVLAEGDLLGIFPEGSITKDGQLGVFKAGILKILSMQQAPVIPMSLNQLWGSFFSRIEKGHAMVKPFRRGLFNPVTLVVGSPLAPQQVQTETLRQEVLNLSS